MSVEAITYNCDTSFKVRFKSASFGSPNRAFTGITLQYTADVVRNSNNTTVPIGSIAEWTEVGQIFPKMNVGSPTVDLSTNTIHNSMQGVQTGMDSVRIKVGVPGGSDIYRAACTTLPVDVQSGTPSSIAFAPASDRTVPVDRLQAVTASVRNNAGTALPQPGLTFTQVSGAAVTITRQSDSVFQVQPNALGWAYLQASISGLTRSYALNICGLSTQATSVTLNRPLPTLLPGGSATASGAARNCAGEQIINPSWRSSNPTVATVSASGVIHALYPGATYITIYNGALADSALLTVKLSPPSIQGSVVYDPSYPTGMAHLSWSSVMGATSYKIFRRCQMANGYTPGWDLWNNISDTSWNGDYVMSYSGIFPEDGGYMAYYVVATGDGGNESNPSETLYFRWDEVAEPGC